MVNTNYKQWFWGKKKQNEFFELLESFSKLLKCDFLQLFSDPSIEGHFHNAYTLTPHHDISEHFGQQNKDFAEKLITDKNIQHFDRRQIIEKGADRAFLKHSSFNHFIYLPLNIGEKNLGLISIHYQNQQPLASLNLEYYIKEWSYILSKSMESKSYEDDVVEHALLASLSFTLASVRSRKHLANIFENQLKSFLGFSQSTLFLIDHEKNSVVNFFGNIHVANSSYAFHNILAMDKIPVDDQLSFKLMGMHSPRVVDFDQIAETKEIRPFLTSKFAEGSKEGILFNLFRGEEIIGNWILLYNDEEVTKKSGIKVLELVANQISIAVNLIVTGEKLHACKDKADIIQSLSADFSATRDKENLLNIIHHKLAKFFDFTHNWVALINEDELTVTSFLRDAESISRYHPQYQEVISSKYPISDGIFNKVLLSKDPVVFDLEKQLIKGVMPNYLQLLYKTGIKKIVMSVLQVRSTTIGVWAICLVEKQEMSANQLELVKNLSSQFSIAVDNIRVNELIKAKEAETEQQLKLSFGLTTIRNKADLQRVLLQNLNMLIDYDDVVIMLADDDKTYSNFLVIQQSASADQASNTHYEGVFKIKGSCFNQVALSADVLVLDMETILQATEVPPFILYEHEHGIVEKIGIAISGENEVIGILFINLIKKGAYTDHALQLVKGISYQLSTAIANILANEKITKRENERNLLLSLSTHIAAVRSHDDLLKLITSEIKPILGFRHTFISRLDHEDNTFTSFLIDPESKSKGHPLYKSVVNKRQSVNDGILDIFFTRHEPVIYDLAQLAEQRHLPEYLQMNYDSGISHVLLTGLENRGVVFGFWLIFFDQRKFAEMANLNLVYGLANQIAVALTNIVSNDKIDQREKEKTRLIDFSNAIASARGKNTIAKVLKRQLKELFGISDYVFFLLNETKETLTPYLFDHDAVFVKNADFIQMLTVPTDINDGLFRNIIDTGNIEMLDISTLSENRTFLSFLSPSNAGENQLITGNVICLGKEVIGVIILWHQENNLLATQVKLWKSICSQLAIAISNITATEKINFQLQEINSYKSRLEEEKIYLKEEIETVYNPTEIIGDSPEMKKTFKLLTKVAASDSTVLILGETGTGKELIARAIHNNSPRKNELMVKVNCAALPVNLIESELFGHEKGSFTGATERRIGKFELANKGTLFLDEIGEMPLELQVKLLRALQEKEIERVGGNTTIKIDVRIITATNRDLEKEMKEGRFRSDLYYRLNIFPIHLPALRHRKEDIPVLAAFFINRFSKKSGKKISTLSNSALQEMITYPWPGNVREMEHLIERSILLTTGDSLKSIDLPDFKEITNQHTVIEEWLPSTIDDNEREHILKTLNYCGGKISGKAGAAIILGVPTSTLTSKIKRLGIKKEHIKTENN